jgi:hypothetical protein
VRAPALSEAYPGLGPRACPDSSQRAGQGVVEGLVLSSAEGSKGQPFKYAEADHR